MPVVLPRLPARSLGEPAESRWRAQPEVPHPLLCVERRPPFEIRAQVRPQADALLRVPLETAVVVVRDEVIPTRVVERGVDESRRRIRRQVPVPPRLARRARADVVHDRRVEMTVLVPGVRAPAVLVKPTHGEHDARGTAIESGDEVALRGPERTAAGPHLESGKLI